MTDAPGGPADRLLPDVVARAAEAAPDRAAVVHHSGTTTFAELHHRVRATAARAAQTAPPGGTIAAIGPNHPGWVDLYYGVPAAGRVLVFLNHRRSAGELAELLARSGAAAVVGDPVQLERLAAAGVELPRHDWSAWSEVVEGSAGERTPPGSGAPAAVDPQAPAWLLFTSGTTAEPKGATLTHRSVLAAVAASSAARPVPADDVYLLPFPLCHVAGYNLVHRHAHARPVVLVDGFEPGSFCAAVAAAGVTSTSLAATMLAALLDHLDAHPGDRPGLATLRAVAYGAAPMPAALLHRAADALGTEFAQGYGMTELSGNAVFLGPEEHRRGLAGDDAVLRAAGRPAPGVEVRIAGADDEPLPSGAVGEILVRAPQVMAGYWGAPEATAAALRGGWLHTGDVGRVDDEGLLHVVDRSKDVIITGGENVSSRRVEDALREQAAVADVAVVGVPDPTWGENVCAVVVPRDGTDLDVDALLAAVRPALAGFEVPRHVVVVDALPVNAAGKVVKADLRRMLADDPGRAGPRR